MNRKNTSKKKRVPAKSMARPPKAARDSFTMPQDEHQFLETIQQNCLDEAVYVTKSEILRAGLAVIRKMPTSRILKIISNLPKLSPGRPRKHEDDT